MAMLGALLLLALAAITATVTRRLRVPYALGLAATGVLLGQLAPRFPELTLPTLTPKLLFAVLLPPLLFDASCALPAKDVQKSAGLIALLAVPGVIVGTLLGALATWGVLRLVGAPVTPTEALIFAAIVSATDPVVVVALLRDLGASPAVRVVLDGESLLNDAMAVLILALVLAFTGDASMTVGSALSLTARTILDAALGLAIGAAVGEIGHRLVRKNGDDVVAIVLTLLVAYGSYLVAGLLHASSILAVIAAGFVFGNRCKERPPSVHSFWTFAAFAADTLVFLLVGATLEPRRMMTALVPIAAVWIALLFVRGAFVLPFVQITRGDLQGTAREKRILVVGGLRGALSMVLALGSAPSGSRSRIVDLTFGVVALTLFVQGGGLAVALRRVDPGLSPS